MIAVSLLEVEPMRVAAWQALSDLFLDTKLDEADIAAIARELIATKFSIEELEHIYEEEVAPACWPNLNVMPGGSWQGFSKEWLVNAIHKSKNKARLLQGLYFVKRLRIRRWTSTTREGWERVKQQLAKMGG